MKMLLDYLRKSVADPEFPRGGVLTPKVGCQPIIWSFFPEKLLENERIWTEKGARPWHSLDLPMKMSATCSVNDALPTTVLECIL